LFYVIKAAKILYNTNCFIMSSYLECHKFKGEFAAQPPTARSRVLRWRQQKENVILIVYSWH